MKTIAQYTLVLGTVALIMFLIVSAVMGVVSLTE